MVGVHKSDVVVVLATKGVLTRPWCLLEMWEAAVNQIPIVLFPVVGGGWTPDDARTLLSDLMGQMQARNPTCMAEVMAHVGKQGVTDVRKVEDVLLAHIGLVSSLERPGRPASMDLDRRLCAHLKRDVAELASWLPAHNKVVEQRLSFTSWQSWGSDNHRSSRRCRRCLASALWPSGGRSLNGRIRGHRAQGVVMRGTVQT